MRKWIVALSVAILLMAATALAQDTVTIAVVDYQSSLEKGYSDFRGSVHSAIVMAAQDALARGDWDSAVAIDVLQVETDPYDTEDHDRIGEYLLEAGVAGVVLGVDDHAARTILERLGPAGVPVLLIQSVDPRLTAQGWLNVWRVSNSDLLAQMQLAAFTVDLLGAGSVYTVCPGQPGSKVCQGSELFAAFAHEKGAAVLGMDNVMEYKDTDPVMEKIAQAGPDVVYMDGDPADARGFLFNLRYVHGLNPVMVMGPLACKETFFADHLDSQAGVYCPFRVYEREARYTEFERDFEQRTEHQPRFTAAFAYDAATALLAAINHAGTTEPWAVRGAMLGLDFDGVTKHISFDEYGDTLPNYTIVVTYDTGLKLVYAPATGTLYQ